MHFPPVRDIVRRYSPWLPLVDTARRSSPRVAQAVIARRSPSWLPLTAAGRPHGILAPRRPGANAAVALRACSLSAPGTQ